MGANLKIESLGDVVRNECNLYVECWCEWRSVVDAKKMFRWYACHIYSTHWARLGDHLRCRRCRARPRYWRLSRSQPNAPDRFPRSEEEWSQLVRKLRNR